MVVHPRRQLVGEQVLSSTVKLPKMCREACPSRIENVCITSFRVQEMPVSPTVDVTIDTGGSDPKSHGAVEPEHAC